eukprot:scaffold142586_cov21-Tisochrysis_lutea.AAC.1
MPVSDDGGSTAEIVRVLGGPAVGDIRSRCIRLADSSDEEVKEVHVCAVCWRCLCLADSRDEELLKDVCA